MVVSKAGHEDKPRKTYVFEYPDGTTAKFYIKDDYVYAPSGEQPAFWINAGYWYPNPHASCPSQLGFMGEQMPRRGSGWHCADFLGTFLQRADYFTKTNGDIRWVLVKARCSGC